MTKQNWTGGIFLIEHGGYAIVLKALYHYKKRVETVGSTPGLKDNAPMFIQLLQEQGQKTKPKIEQTIDKIKRSLLDPGVLVELESEIETIKQALKSYSSDIKKGIETDQKYYHDILPDKPQNLKSDLEAIDTAYKKIQEYSD